MTIAIGVIVCLPSAATAAPRDFTQQFTRNVTGDVTGTANTLMTCNVSESPCADARARTATRLADLNNNEYDMSTSTRTRPVLRRASPCSTPRPRT